MTRPRLAATVVAAVAATALVAPLTSADASPSNTDGTTVIKGRVGDHAHPFLDANRTAAADYQQVKVQRKKNGAFRVEWSLAKFPKSRSAKDMSGKKGTVQRTLMLNLAWYDTKKTQQATNYTLWYRESEKNSKLATKPWVTRDGDATSQSYSMSCKKGSVKVDSKKAKVVINVPASCLKLKKTPAKVEVWPETALSFKPKGGEYGYWADDRASDITKLKLK